jgi:CRP-like cAMP-binding protein
MTALAGNREQRYQSARELKLALERFLAGAWLFGARTFAAGEVIMREGEPGEEAYIILSGACEAHRMESGARVLLRRMGPGDVFGETAIITAQPRSATVTAVEATTATVVTREALEEKLGMDSWLGAFVRALGNRFREAEQRLDKKRRSATFARVTEAIKVHIAAAGAGVGDWIEAPWARLQAALATELDLSEDMVALAVLDSAELKLDLGRDVIRRRGAR